MNLTENVLIKVGHLTLHEPLLSWYVWQILKQTMTFRDNFFIIFSLNLNSESWNWIKLSCDKILNKTLFMVTDSELEGWFRGCQGEQNIISKMWDLRVKIISTHTDMTYLLHPKGKVLKKWIEFSL